MAVVSDLELFLSAVRRRPARAPLRRSRFAVEMSEIDRYGEMRPPWAIFPSYNPYSLGFRMGPGEDYATAYWDWWRTVSRFMTRGDRLAYLRRWPGRAQWTGTMITMIWKVDERSIAPHADPAVRAQWFAKGERRGLPSMAQCDADYDPTDGRGQA